MFKKEFTIANKHFIFEGDEIITKESKQLLESKDVESEIQALIRISIKNKDENDWLIVAFLMGGLIRANSAMIKELLSDKPGFALEGDGQVELNLKDKLWHFMISNEVLMTEKDGWQLFYEFFKSIVDYVENVWGDPYVKDSWIVEIKKSLPKLKELAEA